MNLVTQIPTSTEMSIIDGKAIAQRVLAEIKADVQLLKAQQIEPCLAVILLGDDPASHVYVRNKVEKALEVGIRSLEFRFAAETTAEILLEKIDQLNADPTVNGILVQLPLPAHIDEILVLQRIDPIKDVDGFHSENVGGLSQGRDVLTPCTPTGCIRLLKETLGENLSGLHAVVVGRSNIVGKPMAALLLQENCTVTIVHSRTKNIQEICKTADILVAAVGQPHMINASYLKPQAVVIDVGINRIQHNGQNRLVGDVDFADVVSQVKAITPVPGGVGPMTIAYLMKNTLNAARLQIQSF
ncbi:MULTISPECIES: bifunctional methylenetetrahydrofolate dehydrogenase/methenyltetrahydrofolate cyclohydrolase FolD [unclassified Acinetobacter]|uniref:bifunctional 5,10-methylenetetrahydrofolate dehydrogenase/5,10-methenyltetrahydrofolate cyclohydrolase n=1 Tax=unclassified Acinetobacter TaxID=196816 RepID=UPI0029347672|nr:MULTISPECIES: bifunctional methylenetetrahydrofolate dehydrogenase/methenyltetrahydrofolate cyclohydrolase FolD [unclassified Acinetobacter]WOE32450.1 bifunctional methylenetetrahydrofolate dehydrogenase/methenyltetrahydrofolate cyclohydrolase FolD [Acinetobacter sp. SAAs470]WOE37925.1 bifunctional methylenetetrahydrofolate dehydrogenase/methenyltetrahydrofolate cyclohydrolase FolD [Acinetobacter sp. SAAs474]